MGRAVIVDAVRTPIGRRQGALSEWSAVALLRHVLVELLRRSDVAPSAVGQVVGGCVTQVGEQALNVTRNAWLCSGMDYEVPCTTVDVSCGSSQQAAHFVASLIDAGEIDVGISCGVESMSRVPIASNVRNGPGHYLTEDYPWDDPPRLQFGGAERIARRQGHGRDDLDSFALRSHALAAAAWDSGRFASEIVAVPPPAIGLAADVTSDEGIRECDRAALAALVPLMEDGVHTAATASQVSDGAAAILWMSEERARSEGLVPRARLLAQVVTGADPYYLLDGPVVATCKVLDRTGLALKDIEVCEVNEAFASVVLSWVEHVGADLDRVNVNGGAIACQGTRWARPERACSRRR